MTPTMRCVTCQVDKPLDAFELFRSTCRDCRNARKRVKVRKVRAITPPIGRFLALVDKGSPDQCWLWQGARVGHYGKFSPGTDQQELAHRYAHKIWIGPIADDQQCCHSCDTPSCCNPHHLWAGAPVENIHDCRDKNRHDRKLEIADVIEMRRLRSDEKQTYPEIASRFGVTPGCARHAVTGRTWGHVG